MANHPSPCNCPSCLRGQPVNVVTVIRLAQNPFNRIENREAELRSNLKTRASFDRILK